MRKAVRATVTTAAIGIAMLPWKLYADASAYIFTWLLGYSSLMGAIGGILIADYWVLRRCQLAPIDLFKLEGRYTYTNGINWRAMIALVQRAINLDTNARLVAQLLAMGDKEPLYIKPNPPNPANEGAAPRT